MGVFEKLFGKKRREDAETAAPAEETVTEAADTGTQTADAQTQAPGTQTAGAQTPGQDAGGYEPVDVNRPLENFRLNVLLKEMKENRTETGMNMLFEEIVMHAHFLSVIFLSEEPEPDGSGKAVFPKGAVMRMPMVSVPDGRSFYPVFTDHEQLAKWEQMKAPKTLILTFDDYAAMVLKNEQAAGIVLNPFSDNFVLDRKMIEHLKTGKDLRTKGVSRQKITKDTKVLLGEPKEYPAAMVEAVRSYLAGVPEVKRVWLRLMQRDALQSFLLVVDFEGDRDAVFQGIAGAVRPHLGKKYLDMVSWQDDFGKKATEKIIPFYQRQA